MSANVNNLVNNRKRLARIRCAKDVIKSFQNNSPLPEAFCYIPCKLEYKTSRKTRIFLQKIPKNESERVKEINCTAGCLVIAEGETTSNNQGQWVNVNQVL